MFRPYVPAGGGFQTARLRASGARVRAPDRALYAPEAPQEQLFLPS